MKLKIFLIKFNICIKIDNKDITSKFLVLNIFVTITTQISIVE
jgi:hypothetical protein